jgi:hypothetical protein
VKPVTRMTLRFIFGGYAGGLFMATHWPNAKIDLGVPRSDLWVHVTVFGGWTGLLIASEAWGRATSAHNIRWSVISGLIYAAFDELLQGIPFLNRVVALDDYLANAAGIVLAGIVAWSIDRMGRGAKSSREFRS